jgi:RNA-directed DNA polymerase
MWQIYGEKETCGTKGGLVSKWKQSMNLVVTTNGEKSAEVIVPRRLQTSWEGLNFRRYKLMNVTESRFKNRQLHMEDYLQMVSAEQKEYAEVFDYRKIAEKSSIITGYWTDNLLDLILRKDNLNKAYKRVKSNKGAGGTDGMQVDELLPYLKENQETLIWQIRNGRYKPNPVRRVEIPKETKGEYRKLGVPTVVDRVIQQAITQELMPIYEEQFSENRFGFRPQKGQHDALRQCQKNVNDGYVYVVDMDLEKFFDTVCQSKLIEVLSRTIKDGRVISLIHKYLNAGVLVKGMFERTEIARFVYIGVTQLRKPEEEVLLTPLGELMDQWELHKQFLGIAKPKREVFIEDIIPEGI